MPYEWMQQGGRVELRLWPHRSLPLRGFVWFISLTAAMLALPLLAVVGTSILWGLLPFSIITISGIWYALQRTYRSGETRETLYIDRQSLHLIRHDHGRPEREWRANPYWVRPVLRDGPVEDYLTLTDGTRELELGAFLTQGERRELHGELLLVLAQLR